MRDLVSVRVDSVHSGVTQRDANERTLISGRCGRDKPLAFDQIEIGRELSRKRGDVIAAHGEPCALLGPLGGKRRDDQGPSGLHCPRCDGPIRLPVIRFNKKVEDRPVVPEPPTTIRPATRHIRSDPTDDVGMLAQRLPRCAESSFADVEHGQISVSEPRHPMASGRPRHRRRVHPYAALTTVLVCETTTSLRTALPCAERSNGPVSSGPGAEQSLI